MTLDEQGVPTAPLGSRYRLDGRIGSGGMAEVFAATDLVLERRVAVKRISPALAGDEVARRRFQREARALASTHDPSIVQVFDVGEDDDGPYLVMELVDGTTLRAVLDREGRLETTRALTIAAAVAQGLAAVHAHGVVHRDVKPSNIFVTDDDQVKVGDFGIARIAEGVAVTRTGEVLGSAPYIAPEQLTGGTVGPAADLYGLGCVAFEMLAGRPPFDGAEPVALTYRHLHETPPRLDAIRPDVPRPIADVVERLLAKDPGDRPGSADEARRQLVAAAGSPSQNIPAEATTVPLARPAVEDAETTERLDPNPTAPLPPPVLATPTLPPIPDRETPSPSPSPPPPSHEPPEPLHVPRHANLPSRPWFRWALGGAALLLAVLLLAGPLRDRGGVGQTAASNSPSAGQRSPSPTLSTTAPSTPASAGAALVDLANRLATAGQIGPDIASDVQHTVAEVLQASGGGDGGNQDQVLEKIDALNEKIDQGLERGHIASFDAARQLHQAADAFVRTLSPAGD